MFAATDVDDLVVLTTLFALARGGRGPSARQIVLGQYLGIGTLVAASALAAFGLLLIPDDYTRFLGLVPLVLGLWMLVRRSEGGHALPARMGAPGIAGITVANGGDNVAVYVPFFTSAGGGALPLIVLVFAVMTGLWCAAAYALGTRPRVLAAIERHEHWFVPVVFIALGTVILLG